MDIDKRNKKNIIPIVFAVDDNYAPYLAVTLKSIIENSSENNFYKIFVLYVNLNNVNKIKIKSLEKENFEINFLNTEKEILTINTKLCLRDYYTNATYLRFFIPSIFTQYDKVLYLDSDLVVLDDVANLYNMDLQENLIGAVQEEVMAKMKVFGDYVEEGLGIPCEKYFNAGVMVLNVKELRKFNVLERFLSLLKKFRFEVTQDQDYLNVLCQGRVKYLDLGFNKAPFVDEVFNDEELKIIHYKLSFKPWLYDNVLYSKYFWEYAEQTPYLDEILKVKGGFTKEMKQKDELDFKKLQQMAIEYTNSLTNYKRAISKNVV